MIDINNLGTFSDINAVWSAYPEGGNEGDYLYIGTVKYRWNKYERIWQTAGEVTESPARKLVTNYGDMAVNNDLWVGGTLHYHRLQGFDLGLFASSTALSTAYPTPQIGQWAVVVHPEEEGKYQIYSCATAGTWTLLVEDSSLDILNYPKELIDAMQQIADGRALTGYRAFTSLSLLPSTDVDPTLGYIVGGHLYVWVGTGGDTRNGKYQDCGYLRGEKGDKGDKGDTGDTGEQGPKGDTVILGDGEEYTLYNISGQNTDGAMTQKAVTDFVDTVQEDVDEIKQTLASEDNYHTVAFILDNSEDGEVSYGYPGLTNANAEYTLGGNSLKCLAKTSYPYTYGPEIIGKNTNLVEVSSKKCVRFHYKVVNCKGSVQFRKYDSTGEYVSGHTQLIQLQAGENDYQGVISNYSGSTPSAYISLDIAGIKSGSTDIIDATQEAYVEISNLRYEDIVPAHTNGLEEQVELNTSDIADLKQDGINVDAYINDSDDAAFDRQYIETNMPYWMTDSENPTGRVYDADGGYLERKLAAIPDGKHFIVFTDTHVEYDYNKEFHLINYVRKRLGGCKVLFLGDAIDAGKIPSGEHVGERSTDLGKRRLAWFTNKFYNTCGNDAVYVLGNHDSNDANNNTFPTGTIYEKDIYNIIYKSRKNYVFDEEAYAKIDELDGLTSDQIANLKAWTKMTYYIDDHYNKVRFICLETGVPGSVLRNVFAFGSWTHYTKYIEQFFLAKALLSLPADYDVVIAGHMIGYQGTVYESSSHLFYNLIQAFRGKTSITLNKNIPADYQGTVYCSQQYRDWVNSMNATYDFSNANSAGKIFFVNGHYHVDGQYILQKDDNDVIASYWYDDSLTINSDGILFVRTDRDCYDSLGRNVEGKDHTWEKTEGTTTEQLFDVVTVLDDKILFTRFGPGDDREFAYNQ